MRFCVPLAVLLVGSSLSAPTAAAGEPLKYPKTKRIEHVDVFHGVKVPDPYRWLEQDARSSREVANWIADENKLTEGYLKAIPQRAAIRKRLAELWDYERYSTPTRAGKYYVYSKKDGLQHQGVLYVLDKLHGKPRLLIDPNAWSKDGSVRLIDLSVSHDGKYVAYGVSESGSDWTTWKILETATGNKLTDELKGARFDDAAWTPDNAGLFYTRYSEPKEEDRFQGLVFNGKLCYHKLGTPQSEDRVVYERADHKDWGFNPRVTDDGRYLVIVIWSGTRHRFRIAYKDLKAKDARPVELIDNFEHRHDFVGNDGPMLYFRTDLKAPRGRVIAIDVARPEPANYKEVIPQTADNLSSAQLVGNTFLCVYLKDAHTQVKTYDLAGRFIREVELPTLGTAGGFDGKRKSTETFYSFASFATPPRIYRYDLLTGKSELFRQGKVAFDPADYEVKQEFCKSKDGTRIPIFLTYKKGLKLNGNNPALLYGFGGFNVSLTPLFAPARLQWCEMGGVFAVANVRGGGEYGKEWHQAAIKTKRQVACDDFIAAAEWLIARKYTQKKKLAIQGFSNGGLLVGACMTQRPELYGACLPAVGVMDLLRYHKLKAGRHWVEEHGSSDNREEFKALHKLSPYHNLKPGVRYPATLVTTADQDERVAPSHSFKFVAQLQHCQAGAAPVLARIETGAAHGPGRPTAKAIEEAADQLAFLVKSLEMK